jgi:hypothetical protein
MQKFGLKVKNTRHYKVTTDGRHNYPVAHNLLDRPFEVDRADTMWTADITYIFISRKTVKAEVIDYITFYNTDLLYSTLGYLSPMDYKNFKISNVT